MVVLTFVLWNMLAETVPGVPPSIICSPFISTSKEDTLTLCIHPTDQLLDLVLESSFFNCSYFPTVCHITTDIIKWYTICPCFKEFIVYVYPGLTSCTNSRHQSILHCRSLSGVVFSIVATFPQYVILLHILLNGIQFALALKNS